MKYYNLLFFMGMLMVLSCTGKSSTEQPVAAVEAAMAPPAESSMPAMHIVDSVVKNGHRYIYKVERDAIDSVFVTDEDGMEYNDNRIRVEVSCDGAVMFQHTFTKHDFAGYIDNSMMKHGILDGCRFARVDGGDVIFSMSVSIPMSDFSSPFFVSMTRGGTYTITVDHTLDMDNTNDSTKLANE